MVFIKQQTSGLGAPHCNLLVDFKCLRCHLSACGQQFDDALSSMVPQNQATDPQQPEGLEHSGSDQKCGRDPAASSRTSHHRALSCSEETRGSNRADSLAVDGVNSAQSGDLSLFERDFLACSLAYKPRTPACLESKHGGNLRA